MWRPLPLFTMNPDPASRTHSSVKRRRCNVSKAKGSKRSKRGPSIDKLPNEILQLILEHFALFDVSLQLRLVCRRFGAILSSILPLSVYASASTLPYKGYNEYHIIKLRLYGSSKLALSPPRMNVPLCVMDSHIRHVTVNLSHSENYGNYGMARKRKTYGSLLLRIVKHMPGLKSVKLLHNLNKIGVGYSKFSPIELEKSQTGMDKLIASCLNCIPANIHTEVELSMFADDLTGTLVSLRPADWTIWQQDIRFSTPKERAIIEQWPKSIEQVWGMIDSLDIGARVETTGFLEIGGMTRERNWHIFHLQNRMVPGAFLSLQFPKGFPLNLKKLHLRDPLIVNCTEVLGFLRECKHLKELSLFAVFNLEKEHEHGLPPELETLELFESGGTLLPTCAELTQFRYTFIGEPSTDDMNTVRQFIESSHIPQLEVNVVSFEDLWDATDPFLGVDIISAPRSLGRYLLQEMSCDYYQFSGRQSSCRISKRATRSTKEYIVNLAKSS
uniref:ARAD1A13706p n=1 Tax=Blastobotrys adeninivorans TaxID=409370 RepID=A0A060T375_BLAAD